MSRKHLKREPQYVGKYDSWWYYEENAGIRIVIPDGALTRHLRIPWARIRAALKRKDMKP